MSTSVFPRMHVSLYVNDLERTINFYNQFFGRYPVKIKPKYAKYILDQPSLIISFVENPQRVQSHFGHLGFQVESLEIMQEALNRLKELELVTREEMGTNCCYARQDKFWVNDPDGVEWEVYYFHEDAEFNDPRYELEDNKLMQSFNSLTVINQQPCCEPVNSMTNEQACCEPLNKTNVPVSGISCC